MKPVLTLFLLIGFAVCAAHAQGNYEIQVYGADTVAPRTTMVELHSNFTADGQRKFIDGVAPTYRAEHETIEAKTHLSFPTSMSQSAQRLLSGSLSRARSIRSCLSLIDILAILVEKI